MSNDPREPESGCHVILVAIAVHGGTREEAERSLYERLPTPDDKIKPGEHDVVDVLNPVECWWIAEDTRHDRSDNDSALFVPMGKVDQAVAALRDADVISV